MVEYVGQSVERKEDYRLLTGTGLFVADIQLNDMTEAAFVRSTHAHAKIKHIDTTAAMNIEGVAAVIIAQDLEGEVELFTEFIEFSVPDTLQKEINSKIKPCPEELLAKDRVLHVGQPVAIVVAEDRYIAEDAAALVQIQYEPLPIVTDPKMALSSNSIVIHPHMGNNLQSEFSFSTGDTKSAFQKADYVVKERIKIPRLAANPIETRGVVASYDRRYGQLQVWSSTQVPFMVRTYLSKLLHIDEENIRVIAPDIGGAFGPKGSVYPEEILVPYLSMKLKRPVKWIEDRMEHLQSTRHSRDQEHDVEVAFKRDGTLLGLKDHFILDCGAFNPFALTCAHNTATHLRGIYKIPNFSISCQIVMTNKTPNVPMRGAGRPEAAFVMDRIIEIVASKLNIDPVEVIFKNIIQPEEMPYKQNMIYRDGVEIVYDKGNFPGGLKKALEIVDYEEFRQKQKEMQKEGKCIGIGISSSVEGTGVGPFEGARLKLSPSGKVMVYVGSTPQGQSHETTLAQICADVFDMSPKEITVKAGDTSLLPFGVGTYASRSAVNAGSAVQIASHKLKDKLLSIAEVITGVSKSELFMKDGIIYSPDRTLSLQELALAAQPGPYCKVPEGMEPGVEVTHYFTPPTVTWTSGFHVAIVEVDKLTGFIDILRYIVVHDSGKILNPMVVEGQIQGGVAQGVGSALYEEIVYDDNGQLISGTYMDYLLPTAMEVPDIEIAHHSFLSSGNPLGVKGVGESGAIPPTAAITNAVIDALKPLSIKINSLPISPSKLLQIINKSENTR